MEEIKEDCEICYQIACKKCEWVASDQEVIDIRKGELIECPKCGWKPGNDYDSSTSSG